MKTEYSIPLSRILHEKYGFCVFPGSPTEQDKEQYERVCQLLGRTDLPFTPNVPVLYERSLSRITSLIIEGTLLITGTGLSLSYRYDFYKARYIGSNEPKSIKVYGEQLKRQELLRLVNHFKFLKQK